MRWGGRKRRLKEKTRNETVIEIIVRNGGNREGKEE